MAIIKIRTSEFVGVEDRNLTSKRWFDGLKMFYTIKVLPVVYTETLFRLEVKVKDKVSAKATLLLDN